MENWLIPFSWAGTDSYRSCSGPYSSREVHPDGCAISVHDELLCLQLYKVHEPGNCFPVDRLSEQGSNRDQVGLQDYLDRMPKLYWSNPNWAHQPILLLDDASSEIGLRGRPICSCYKRVVLASKLCLCCRPVSTHLPLVASIPSSRLLFTWPWHS